MPFQHPRIVQAGITINPQQFAEGELILDFPRQKIVSKNNIGELVDFPVDFPEAPIDGALYARKDGNWQSFSGFIDAPLDSTSYVRNNGNWISENLDHSLLTNRSDSNSHPASAIQLTSGTNLESEVGSINSQLSTVNSDISTIEGNISTIEGDISGINTTLTSKASYSDVTNSQEELLQQGSKIYPAIGTLTNGMTVPTGTTHIRVLVNGEPTILIAWDDLVLPATVSSVPTVDNGFSGYVVNTSTGNFEFVPEVIHAARNLGDAYGWGLGGTTSDEIVVQKTIDDTPTGNVWVDKVDLTFASSVFLKSNRTIKFSPRTLVRPTANNTYLLSTPVGSFTDVSPVLTQNCKVYDFKFSFDGFSNCRGARLGNFRHGSGIYRALGFNDDSEPTLPVVDRGNKGIDFEILCWSTDLQNCYMRNGFSRSYHLREGSNAITVFNCRSNFADIGILVEDGSTYATEDVQILGGWYQNSQINIFDRATHTVIDGVYSERALIADVNFEDASFPVIESLHLTAPSALPTSVGIKGRTTEGASIKGIINVRGDGAGTFDFDSSNDRCFAEYQNSSTVGNNLGNVTGLKLKSNYIESTAQLGDIGIDDDGHLVANVGVIGSVDFPRRTVRLNNGIKKATVPAGNVFGIGADYDLFRKNISGDVAFTVSGTPQPWQEITIALFTSTDLTSNTITFEGQDIDTSTATGGSRVALFRAIYMADLVRWSLSPVKWETSV